jgi:hypothetical protein
MALVAALMISRRWSPSRPRSTVVSVRLVE